MREFSTSFDVFSPRWGHTDRYYVTFTESEMRIQQGTFSAVCKHRPKLDPEWSGYSEQTGNPLMKIFSNDSIYAPEIVPDALEWAWSQWREQAMDDDTVREGLEELFGWVDSTARDKPKSRLWQPFF